MIDLKHRVKEFIGIDKAIFYTIMGRLIQGVSGIVAVYFIANYLSSSEQGYYYTFGSILALQVFFELGLSNIITQFTSKVFSKLELKNNAIVGDEENLSYLSSILQLSLNWFIASAIFLFIFLSIVGSVFFSNTQTDNVMWFYPWILTSFSTSILLIVIPYISFLTGLNKVEFTAKIRFWQYLSQLIFLILFFVSQFGLYSKALSNLLSVVLVIIILYKSPYLFVLKELQKKIGSKRIDYLKEIFPYQWKITISWLSGFLIFQLFNPIIFAFDGSVSAGKMGMTLVMLTGIQTIAISWISTKVPLFTKLATSNEFYELDNVFKKTFWQSTLLCFLGLFLFCLFIYLLDLYKVMYIEKFLDQKNILLLSIATLSNHIMSSLAIYLRSYLKEPLMKMSILIGVLMALSSYVLGKSFGVDGVVFGYFFIMTFICLPWTIIIYKKCKINWQKIDK